MTKTAKSTKLLFAFVVVLSVLLIAAFTMSAQANAEGLDIEEISVPSLGDVMNDVAEIFVDNKGGFSPIPGEDDFLSDEGHNFMGGPHWYLYIAHYALLPDDFTMTLWSNCSLPHYSQTLTKADLVARNGLIRVPAAVPVFISSSHSQVKGWAMVDPTIEGAFLVNPATGLWDHYGNLWCTLCTIPAQAVNYQQVYNNTAVMNGIPVGDHTLYLHVILGCDDGDADADCDDDADADADADA
ncbi:MAG: hypothetical protein HUJ66_05095, partial [Oscillospiraceae bacterium]|nr:hypothetical protein [Oscillospiraceae bacterium]